MALKLCRPARLDASSAPRLERSPLSNTRRKERREAVATTEYFAQRRVTVGTADVILVLLGLHVNVDRVE